MDKCLSGRDAPSDEHSTLGLPWRLEDEVVPLMLKGVDGYVVAEGFGNPDAPYTTRNRQASTRAAFILRACNSHAGLVKALKGIVDAEENLADAQTRIFDDEVACAEAVHRAFKKRDAAWGRARATLKRVGG